MRNYLLLFIALILAFVYLPFSWIYTLLGNRFSKENQDEILLGLAITVDILGNIVGLPLYHLFAKKRDGNTLFCKKGITISASIGHLIATDIINKKGLWFSSVLDIAFKERWHCLNAFNQLNLN